MKCGCSPCVSVYLFEYHNRFKNVSFLSFRWTDFLFFLLSFLVFVKYFLLCFRLAAVVFVVVVVVVAFSLSLFLVLSQSKCFEWTILKKNPLNWFVCLRVYLCPDRLVFYFGLHEKVFFCTLFGFEIFVWHQQIEHDFMHNIFSNFFFSFIHLISMVINVFDIVFFLSCWLFSNHQKFAHRFFLLKWN